MDRQSLVWALFMYQSISAQATGGDVTSGGSPGSLAPRKQILCILRLCLVTRILLLKTTTVWKNKKKRMRVLRSLNWCYTTRVKLVNKWRSLEIVDLSLLDPSSWTRA